MAPQAYVWTPCATKNPLGLWVPPVRVVRGGDVITKKVTVSMVHNHGIIQVSTTLETKRANEFAIFSVNYALTGKVVGSIVVAPSRHWKSRQAIVLPPEVA
ncbi:hypothetical protein BaRGS_00029299 [Batillaria attramentaria]|uniref:Uncharacterized protein n=1 Tax=Batillaria attramentaria TaxID=370345 RepID=A0ABD0JX84_9CAEN